MLYSIYRDGQMESPCLVFREDQYEKAKQVVVEYEKSSNLELRLDGTKPKYTLVEKHWDDDPEACVWVEYKEDKFVCQYYGKFYEVEKNFGRWYLLKNHLVICFQPNGVPYVFQMLELNDKFMINHILSKRSGLFDLGNFAKMLLYIMQKYNCVDLKNIVLE